MNAHCLPFSKIISSDQGAHEHYHVPKYQREYSWGKSDWERLLQDIEDNNPGYFMGSIICVDDPEPSMPSSETVYEVIDGQQRLSTLSLLMMAIYDNLKESEATAGFQDEEEKQDFQNTLGSLRNKLVKKLKDGDYQKGDPSGWVEQSKMCYLRVQPSSQSNNEEDYKFLLSEIGLIKQRDKPRYMGVRAIRKAFRYFKDQIPKDIDGLMQLVTKINQLNFVFISVGSQADAFTLFETLNNRGVPLSAIDIIKNKILAEMERQHDQGIDESYQRWQEIISAIPDASDQERFLRHFYHANKWSPKVRIDGIPRAIKSKVILIYERLIKEHPQFIFDRLCDSATVYGKLIDASHGDFGEDICEQLLDLSRINASPAYQVLLYLFSVGKDHIGESDFLVKAVELIRRFYVRRNVTDFPGTRDLDQSHMDLIASCQSHIENGNPLTYDFFLTSFRKTGRIATYSEFEEALRGPMYSLNHLMTRYLLVKLDECHHSREYSPDLWARNPQSKWVWTVEHVLPQTTNLSKSWVEEFAGGDKNQAKSQQGQHVDRLGNLTLSGYNSRLATAAFSKKQTLEENRQFLGHKIDIGYKNGLALNSLEFKLDGKKYSLAKAPRWTAEMIEARTNRMVELLLKMYKIEGVD